VRGRVAGVLLWCAATVGATVLVNGGVGTIRAATRRDTVVDVQAVTVDIPGTSAPTSSSTVTTSTEVPAVSPTTSGGVPATAPPTTGRTSTTGRPSTPTPTTEVPVAPPPSVPVVTAPAPTTAPTAAPTTAPTVTRTVTSRGGTVTVRYRPDEVTIVAAVPNAGYAVEIERSSPTRVRVEFENADDARSRIDLWWDTEARFEVRED
jgi:hypothetical protein